MAEVTFSAGQIARQAQLTPGSTNWYQIYPQTGNTKLDAGMFFNGCSVRSVAAGAVTDGSAFQIAFNSASAPSIGYLVDGSPGSDFLTPPTNFWNVWVKLTAGTDLIDFIGYVP